VNLEMHVTPYLQITRHRRNFSSLSLQLPHSASDHADPRRNPWYSVLGFLALTIAILICFCTEGGDETHSFGVGEKVRSSLGGDEL
jgi:hypothetical protein